MVKEASANWMLEQLEIVSAIVLIFSRIISPSWSVGNSNKSHKTFRKRDIINVEYVVDITPDDAIFATAPTYNHPINNWGNAKAVGFRAHL